MNSWIADIKNSISPKSFYERELEIYLPANNSSGWMITKALCPFHFDRKAGNFSVHVHEGAFKCFSCGECGGDIINFARKRYDLSFSGARRFFLENWGIA